MAKNNSRKPADDGFSSAGRAKTANTVGKTKSENSTKVKTTVTVVCVVLIMAIFIGSIAYSKVVDSGYFYRNTISVKSENYEINNAMMSYFFNTQYQQMSSSFQQMGVDTSKNLKDQIYTSNMSWFDYLMKNVTVPNIERILVLCEAAKAEGFELDEHQREHVDEAVNAIEQMCKTYASNYNMSEKYYLRNVYGYGVNMNDVRDAIELSQIASAYSEKLTDSYDFSEDEWSDYLDEHRDDFLKIDYLSYTFEVEDEESASGTDTAGTADTNDTAGTEGTADTSGVSTDAVSETETAAGARAAGDTTGTDASDTDSSAANSSDATADGTETAEAEEERSAEKQAVYDLAEDVAAQIRYAEDGEEAFNRIIRKHLEDVVYADVEDSEQKVADIDEDMAATVNTAVSNDETSEFIKYAFSSDRDSSTFVAADDTNGKYTVYYITKDPYIEEYVTKNVRLIALSAASGENIEDKLESVLDEFESSDKTEDSFISLVEKYSDDAYASENGGLYENQGKGDSGIDELDDWIFSDDRKAGDYTSVSNGQSDTSEVIYIAYYVGDGIIKWQRDVDNTMVSEAYDEDYSKLAEAHSVDVDYSELYKIPSQAGL